MTSVAPFRLVCRSAPRTLLEDGSGAVQRRAFSCIAPRSYPRLRPARSATSQLQALSSNETQRDDRVQQSKPQFGGHKFVREQEKKTAKNIGKSKADWSATELAPQLKIQTQKEQEIERTTVDDNVVQAEPEAPVQSPEDASLPWYLQSQHAISRPAPPEHLLERQRIPDIPENAPSLLNPLLQYVSVDLGIDYLTMLDLRSLDPPAALGSNLIMLLGTARSEKHLHVSADRLCRWLRSDYKLRPQADGLLGRNELKIKLRRRAKRLKILAHVGSADSPGRDDGLRTGWVCVNVPGLPSESKGEVQQVSEDFIGFGDSSADTTLVLHFLTEEKREELDLEKLWNNRLARMKRKAAQDDIHWSGMSDRGQSQQNELIG